MHFFFINLNKIRCKENEFFLRLICRLKHNGQVLIRFLTVFFALLSRQHEEELEAGDDLALAMEDLLQLQTYSSLVYGEICDLRHLGAAKILDYIPATYNVS
ncbi:hypothetical protein PIB30_106054 [Stylosanthes scabra]|uniref:Uncharacterized protein n=1 Tax=Stylosanthes scabra TaxID=79078 RepID=A0ABU6VXB1_9FABA|nr:hypothetical protein [Stylosanthes scabra]